MLKLSRSYGSLLLLVLVILYSVAWTNKNSGNSAESLATTEVKGKKSHHNKRKWDFHLHLFKKKNKKHRESNRSFWHIFLVIFIVIGGIGLLLLPWFLGLASWITISFYIVVLITTLILAYINSGTSFLSGWRRAIESAVQGCLSAAILIIATILLILIGLIALFGPLGPVYLLGAIGLVKLIADISESIAAKKRNKRHEKKNSTDPTE